MRVLLGIAVVLACDSPVWAGGTFRDLAELAVARREALEACNRQLKAAREYQTGL